MLGATHSIPPKDVCHWMGNVQSITVTYQARSGREYTTAFDGFTAQIIQHEIDHVNGIII